MSIFDIFKKKSTDSTFPENDLETLLLKASSDSSARKDFYVKLLWSELFVLTAEESTLERGNKILEKDTEVKLINLENGVLPVFTSTNRIFDKGYIKEQVPFMAMKGHDLFNLTKGSKLVLNPYSDYGKELLPNEIERLLDGSIFEQTNDITIEKETQIQIGQPKIYPDRLIKSLSDLFKTKPKTKAAYIAVIRINENETEPHYLIGIEYEGQFNEITKVAGPLVEKHLTNNEVVDFVQIDYKSGVSKYLLNETKPFYKKN
nr:enhanced serine sensitivity protein SseB C-terminal domain-containing protein [uncultured Draconibacterium sp.]